MSRRALKPCIRPPHSHFRQQALFMSLHKHRDRSFYFCCIWPHAFKRVGRCLCQNRSPLSWGSHVCPTTAVEYITCIEWYRSRAIYSAGVRHYISGTPRYPCMSARRDLYCTFCWRTPRSVCVDVKLRGWRYRYDWYGVDRQRMRIIQYKACL